jgi:hypothetical protein
MDERIESSSVENTPTYFESELDSIYDAILEILESRDGYSFDSDNYAIDASGFEDLVLKSALTFMDSDEREFIERLIQERAKHSNEEEGYTPISGKWELKTLNKFIRHYHIEFVNEVISGIEEHVTGCMADLKSLQDFRKQAIDPTRKFGIWK